MQHDTQKIADLLFLKLRDRITPEDNAILENLAKESKEIQYLLELVTNKRKFKKEWRALMSMSSKESWKSWIWLQAKFPELRNKPFVEDPPELKDPEKMWLLMKSEID